MKKFFLILSLSFFLGGNTYANDKIWEHNGKYLTEKCFVHEWISGDNFEEFYDRYSPPVIKAYKQLYEELSAKKKVNYFFKFIGNYYVTYIPLDEKFEASWGDDKLSLATSLEKCSKQSIFKIDKTKDYYELVTNPALANEELKTKCLLRGSIIISKAKCLDIKTIQYTQVFPGMSPYSQAIDFGIYEYNNKKIILPLRFNVELPKQIKRTNNLRDDFFEWLSNQNEHFNTNSLYWDDDFKAYLNNTIPKIDLLIGFTGDKKGSLYDNFSAVISGPPDSLKYSEDQRYLLASACRARECPSKGLIWIDTKEEKSIGLIKHAFWESLKNIKEDQILLFSTDYEKIPKEFLDSVKIWMKKNEVTPSVIRMINKNIQIKELPISIFNN